MCLGLQAALFMRPIPLQAMRPGCSFVPSTTISAPVIRRASSTAVRVCVVRLLAVKLEEPEAMAGAMLRFLRGHGLLA